MITAIVILAVVVDDLRLRGKLRSVSNVIKSLEQEFEQEIVRSAVGVVASIKAKL